MEDLIVKFGYLGIGAALAAGGFGFPVPEDIPLLLAGMLCRYGYASLWVMIPYCIAAVLVADMTIYFIGRKWGYHLSKLPLLRTYLSEERLAKAEATFHKRGGLAIMVARFIPGLRTPVFFTAGTFKVPVWKMLMYDGGMAVISVPVMVTLGWVFAYKIEVAKDWAMEFQFVAAIVAVVLLAAYIGYHVWRHKRDARREREAKDVSNTDEARDSDARVASETTDDREVNSEESGAPRDRDAESKRIKSPSKRPSPGMS